MAISKTWLLCWETRKKDKLWTKFKLIVLLSCSTQFHLTSTVYMIVLISEAFVLWESYIKPTLCHVPPLWKYIPSSVNIIIMYLEYRLLCFSLAICFYHLSLTSPLESIQCLHRADECKFLLVGQHWHVHVLESIQECPLWVCPYFLQQYPACLVCLTWMVCEIGGKWSYSSCGHTVYLYSYHLEKFKIKSIFFIF